MGMEASVNVLGGRLESCSMQPRTGYFRDGSCNTCAEDSGQHTVCVITTAEFLAWSKYVGNDLTTPRPEFHFDGLREGDRWCLCASRFLEAHEEGCAPPVVLEATHRRTLDIVPMPVLRLYRVLWPH
ncbi:DUF2237 family protein [Paenirhodobacter sp.]|uniref:DUF2237 family protein n=1 Tax=Paenirhodobacter sp. TaxID=1965326 RepID=UPI003B425B4A